MSEGFLAVLGGNSMAVPAISLMERVGYRTLVLDRSGEAPGRRVASKFAAVDFSDSGATLRALEGTALCGVLPLNDFAVRTAAAVAAQRGLPGASPAAARRLTNKVEMKRAWDAAGLPHPRWISTTRSRLLAGDFPAWSEFPCIVKPAFSGGGSRGVGLARDPAAVADIVAQGAAVYRDEEVVIEEFVAGTEHTVELLMSHGMPQLLSISDKENYRDSISVVQTLHFPGPVGHAHRHLIEPLAAAAARALGLADGTTHTEVIIRDGRPCLIEAGGRPGGGLNFHPICELSTGWSYPVLLAQIMTGKPPDLAQRQPATHLTWQYFEHAPGSVREIRGFAEVAREPDVVAAEMYEKAGLPAFDRRDDLARPGFLLVRGRSHAAARNRAAELASRVVFDLSPRPADPCS